MGTQDLQQATSELAIAPAYEPEIEFVKECIEDGVYDSAAKLAHAVAEVPHVEKIDYVGDLSIGYYGVYITATAYVYEFHRDLYSTSDSYAEAVCSLDKYIDALDEYAKDVIEQMFDSCTFDVWKTSYTQDVEVTSDGIATIYMNSNVWFDGVNLSLPMDKIAAELKQRIDNRHSGDLAGIGNALTEVVVGVHID